MGKRGLDLLQQQQHQYQQLWQHEHQQSRDGGFHSGMGSSKRPCCYEYGHSRSGSGEDADAATTRTISPMNNLVPSTPHQRPLPLRYPTLAKSMFKQRTIAPISSTLSSPRREENHDDDEDDEEDQEYEDSILEIMEEDNQSHSESIAKNHDSFGELHYQTLLSETFCRQEASFWGCSQQNQPPILSHHAIVASEPTQQLLSTTTTTTTSPARRSVTRPTPAVDQLSLLADAVAYEVSKQQPEHEQLSDEEDLYQQWKEATLYDQAIDSDDDHDDDDHHVGDDDAAGDDYDAVSEEQYMEAGKGLPLHQPKSNRTATTVYACTNVIVHPHYADTMPPGIPLHAPPSIPKKLLPGQILVLKE
jgi:hypothetical protein